MNVGSPDTPYLQWSRFRLEDREDQYCLENVQEDEAPLKVMFVEVALYCIFEKNIILVAELAF